MKLQQKQTLNVFDQYMLVIPSHLKWDEDGPPGKRILFISDKLDSFFVTFEEGMEMMDMRQERMGGEPMVTFQCWENGKYIHQKRTVRDGTNVAFFHIEVKDDDGSTMYLPGQMIAEAGYKMSDGVEPILLDILNGITVSRAKGGGSY